MGYMTNFRFRVYRKDENVKAINIVKAIRDMQAENKNIFYPFEHDLIDVETKESYANCHFLEMDIDYQIQMTEVNCNAALYFTRKYLTKMVEYNEGHIINVASIAGFMPGPYMATYHATKGYLLLLGEAISYEIRKTKVKLLTLCPGPFNSEFVAKAGNDYTFKKIKPIDAIDVAKYGYKKSLQGKSVAIVGFKNKLTVFATRFAPRSFITKTSAKTMKKDA